MEFVFNEQLIRDKLKDFDSPERLSMSHEYFTNSAVVFLIIPNEDKPYDLVLIRRTKNKTDKHSGEMSFPGGKFDPKLDKSYFDTAFRELEEELGIPYDYVTFLGCIDDHLTPKGFIISSFVAFITPDVKMAKQKSEVNEIVKIPITFFANKENFKERTYKLKEDLIGVGKFNYKSPDNKKYVVFGATSHIIVKYIDTVYNLGLMTPGCRRINCEDIKDKIIK
ncbi:MAG: CoA pyrophosphatase [Candidatus Lokiarchaeota archaeon]|jgi:8-oxo-dGTP pyrophosphatase MutT (NUDIX family)|nr:CoA pyrophosphatase [Candidatus Lokiarchaeota archaeon]